MANRQIEMEEKAKELFGDRVNITTEGKRHLGAALGSADYRDEYSNKLVEDWTKQLSVLCEIAMTQPQAAYTALCPFFFNFICFYLFFIYFYLFSFLLSHIYLSYIFNDVTVYQNLKLNCFEKI